MIGKEILPGGRDFLHVPRSAPGSGGEERSDEVPEPGVGTWFAWPLRFNEAASVCRKVVHRVPQREWARRNSSSELRVPVSNFPVVRGAGFVRLWTLQSGAQLAELCMPANPPEAALGAQQGHAHPA